MEKIRVNVIIPTYRPGKEFVELLKGIKKQEYQPDKVIIMNTEEEYWDVRWETLCPKIEVHHIKKNEFDHGGTRKAGAALADGSILVFMTQDAVPYDKYLIGNLIKPLLEKEDVGAAYARQLPKEDCSFLEKCARSFNYPEASCIKTEKDMPVYGVKTFFCSNVCAAYRREAYDKVGGFVEKAIFNEDMICAGNMVKAGYGIAYAADAKVVHSHNYTCLQQLHRNFDLGVSQAEHPEIFEGVPSEGEGIRLVKKTAELLMKDGKFWLLPKLVFQSGFKYIGYFMGKKYKKLPSEIILWATMNRAYWKNR